MSSEPPDIRRARSEELAALLVRDGGWRTACLLQHVVLQPRGHSEAAGSLQEVLERLEDPFLPPRPIGTWQPRCDAAGALEFVRSEAPAAQALEGAPRRLPARKPAGQVRVCLLGESAAAGFLSEPVRTPAAVLQHYLDVSSGAGSHLVIDLARAGMQAPELLDVAERARQLDPDVLVAFAGNNWSGLPGLFEGDAREPPSLPLELGAFGQAAGWIRTHGVAGLMEWNLAAARSRAQSVLRALCLVADAAGAVLVVVVPEVNLADFETQHPVYWLRGDGCARWYALYGQARRALERGAPGSALRAAGAMLALDGGACATTHRLRVAALQALGRTGDAVAAARDEMAACTWDARYRRGSGLAESVQQRMREVCQEEGALCVDLPAIFERHTGSPLTGRRLFLDHSHLSAEGVAVAMAAVAVAVLRGTVDPAATEVRLAASLGVRAPASAAVSMFAAGLYNAHLCWPVLGGRAEVARYWFDGALAAWPDIADTMRGYLQARVAPAPPQLSPALRRDAASPCPLPAQAWVARDVGLEVLEPMCDALEHAGVAVREDLAARWQAECSVGPHGEDLSSPRWREHGPGIRALCERDTAGWPVMRARLPESSFYVVPPAAGDVAITLTARLPAVGAASADGLATVMLNGLSLGEVALDERWRQVTFVLPRARCVQGPNRVGVRWPRLPAAGDAAIERIVARLEAGQAADLYPVFGEVFALRAGLR